MAQRVMELQGLSTLLRAMRSAPEMVRAHATSAVAASTFAVMQAARSGVPARTGALRNSITSTASGLTGRVGVGRDGYYWRFVEYGTKYQPARPFFRPAAEQERAIFEQRMRAMVPRLERTLAGGRFT